MSDENENHSDSENSSPKINLTNRRSSRLRGAGPPLSPSHYLTRSHSLESSIDRYQHKSPIPHFNYPRSTVKLVENTCQYLQQHHSPNATSIGQGKPNYSSNFSRNLSPNFSLLKMTSIPPTSTQQTPPLNTNPTTTQLSTSTTQTNTQGLPSASVQSSQTGSVAQQLQTSSFLASPFSDYIDVPKSLINESFKFYGTFNDHSNYKDADDKDQYVSASKWLKYLEQRVANNELARLSLAKATARGPARAIVLEYAGDSLSWLSFKDKVIERYTRRDFKDSAIRVAEVFSGGRKKNQSYELFINEILHTLQEINDYSPDLFTPVGLSKCIFLASIPSGLRQKIDVSVSSIPQCIKLLEMQLDQNRDRYQIEHRAPCDELLYVKRNVEVKQNVPLESNAVVQVKNSNSGQTKSNIFQGTRLVQQNDIVQHKPSYQRRVIRCFYCREPNHLIRDCKAPGVNRPGIDSSGMGEVRNDQRGHRGNDLRGPSTYRNDQKGQSTYKRDFRDQRDSGIVQGKDRNGTAFRSFRGRSSGRSRNANRGQVLAITDGVEELVPESEGHANYEDYENYDYVDYKYEEK